MTVRHPRDARRVRIYEFSLSLLLDLFRTGVRGRLEGGVVARTSCLVAPGPDDEIVVDDGIPADGKIIARRVDEFRNVLELVIESPSFPELNLGDVVDVRQVSVRLVKGGRE